MRETQRACSRTDEGRSVGCQEDTASAAPGMGGPSEREALLQAGREKTCKVERLSLLMCQVSLLRFMSLWCALHRKETARSMVRTSQCLSTFVRSLPAGRKGTCKKRLSVSTKSTAGSSDSVRHCFSEGMTSCVHRILSVLALSVRAARVSRAKRAGRKKRLAKNAGFTKKKRSSQCGPYLVRVIELLSGCERVQDFQDIQVRP